MNGLTLLYVFALFYVFIPGNIIKLPIKTSQLNLVLIHALLFSTILYYTLPIVEGEVIEGVDTCNEKNVQYCLNQTDCISNGGDWDGEQCNNA